MKTVVITMDNDVWQELRRIKGDMTWRELIVNGAKVIQNGRTAN